MEPPAFLGDLDDNLFDTGFLEWAAKNTDPLELDGFDFDSIMGDEASKSAAQVDPYTGDVPEQEVVDCPTCFCPSLEDRSESFKKNLMNLQMAGAHCPVPQPAAPKAPAPIVPVSSHQQKTAQQSTGKKHYKAKANRGSSTPSASQTNKASKRSHSDAGSTSSKRNKQANEDDDEEGGKKRKLPARAVKILQDWMLVSFFEPPLCSRLTRRFSQRYNFHHPYPSDTEKQHLASVCGITLKQLTNWFTNARKRLWIPLRKQRGLPVVQYNEARTAMKEQKMQKIAENLSTPAQPENTTTDISSTVVPGATEEVDLGVEGVQSIEHLVDMAYDAVSGKPLPPSKVVATTPHPRVLERLLQLAVLRSSPKDQSVSGWDSESSVSSANASTEDERQVARCNKLLRRVREISQELFEIGDEAKSMLKVEDPKQVQEASGSEVSEASTTSVADYSQPQPFQSCMPAFLTAESIPSAKTIQVPQQGMYAFPLREDGSAACGQNEWGNYTIDQQGNLCFVAPQQAYAGASFLQGLSLIGQQTSAPTIW